MIDLVSLVACVAARHRTPPPRPPPRRARRASPPRSRRLPGWTSWTRPRDERATPPRVPVDRFQFPFCRVRVGRGGAPSGIGHRQDVARLPASHERVQVAVDARQTLQHVVPVRLRAIVIIVHALAFVVDRAARSSASGGARTSDPTGDAVDDGSRPAAGSRRAPPARPPEAAISTGETPSRAIERRQLLSARGGRPAVAHGARGRRQPRTSTASERVTQLRVGQHAKDRKFGGLQTRFTNRQGTRRSAPRFVSSKRSERFCLRSHIRFSLPGTPRFSRDRARRKTHPARAAGFRRRGATEGLNATGLKPPEADRVRRRSGDECAVVEMHSAYSRQTSNHRFFQIPVARAGAGERRDASAWSSRGAFAVLGSENMPRVSRETSARSRTRSTSPATRPIGAGPLSASGLGRASFLMRDLVPFLGRRMPDRGTGLRRGVDVHRAIRARRGVGTAIALVLRRLPPARDATRGPWRA